LAHRLLRWKGSRRDSRLVRCRWDRGVALTPWRGFSANLMNSADALSWHTYRSAARSILGLVTDPRLSGSSLTKLNINILHHALYNEGQSTPFAKELEVPPPRTGDARYSAPASGLRDPLGVRLVALSSGSRGTGLRDRCGSGGCARGGF
jgi:hypothetical protein